MRWGSSGCRRRAGRCRLGAGCLCGRGAWRGGRRHRRDGLSLSAWCGNGYGVGCPIDHHGVVDVVVDNVRRRWRDVNRPINVDRNWHVDRNRKHINVNRWRRWFQVDKVDRRRRKPDHRRRRRRRKFEFRIVKYQHGPPHINDLFRRRGWNIVGYDCKRSRRRKWGCEIGETASRVIGMRAQRVATQIRPVCARRVDGTGLAPCNRLSACSDDCPHPLCQRIFRIGRNECFIVADCVAVQRRNIGLLRTQLANWLRSNRPDLFGRNSHRRRVRCTLEKCE